MNIAVELLLGMVSARSSSRANARGSNESVDTAWGWVGVEKGEQKEIISSKPEAKEIKGGTASSSIDDAIGGRTDCSQAFCWVTQERGEPKKDSRWGECGTGARERALIPRGCQNWFAAWGLGWT